MLSLGVVLFFTLFLNGCLSAKVKEEGGVIILDDSNFEVVVPELPYVMVQFYASWCQHCKRLSPEYAKAAKTLMKAGSPARLAKIDAVKNTKMAAKYNIESYPTLIFFKNGEPLHYDSHLIPHEIIAWINRKTQPTCRPITTKEELDHLVTPKTVTVVGYFADQNSKEADTYEEVSYILDSHFIITSNKEILQEHKFPHEDKGVVLLTKFEGARIYDGDFSLHDLKTFVKVYSEPHLKEYTSETAKRILQTPENVYLLFLFVDAHKPSHQDVLEIFGDTAHRFRGKATFVFLDNEKQMSQQVLETLKMERSPDPALVAFTLKHFPKKTFIDDINDIPGFVERLLEEQAKSAAE